MPNLETLLHDARLRSGVDNTDGSGAGGNTDGAENPCVPHTSYPDPFDDGWTEDPVDNDPEGVREETCRTGCRRGHRGTGLELFRADGKRSRRSRSAGQVK